MLTFHWRVEEGSQQPAQTMYVVDRPKECIEVVKKRYAAAKLRKRQEEEEEEEDDEEEDEEDGSEESKETSATSAEAKDVQPAVAEVKQEQVIQPAAVVVESKIDVPVAAAAATVAVPDL